MTEPVPSEIADNGGQQVSRRRPLLYWLLIVLLTAEFLVMASVTVGLVVELIVSKPDSLAGGIAIIVLAIVASVWLAFIVVAAVRGRAWMRGASIVWQVLQFAVGIGCFQGYTATPTIGWLLIVPSVVVVLLLISRPVVAVTSHRE